MERKWTILSRFVKGFKKHPIYTIHFYIIWMSFSVTALTISMLRSILSSENYNALLFLNKKLKVLTFLWFYNFHLYKHFCGIILTRVQHTIMSKHSVYLKVIVTNLQSAIFYIRYKSTFSFMIFDKVQDIAIWSMKFQSWPGNGFVVHNLVEQ